MKATLLAPLLTIPVLFSACAPVVVERPVRRSAVVVEHDDYYYRHHPRVRRDVVVVNPRPVVVEPRVSVRYYNDRRGRYYIKDGRRIYVNAGARYY